MSQPKQYDEVLASIATATPPQIDEILAWGWATDASMTVGFMRLQKTERDCFAKIKLIEDGQHVRAGISTPLMAVRLMQKLMRTQIEMKFAAQALLDHKNLVAPFEAEYKRRGGWSRYFLVQNANGHIHSSMHCSTCNREGVSTDFGWMTQFSGKAEQDLTDEVGPNACTVCFPWAETIRIEADAEARRVRADSRAAEKAEKDRVAAEKGITTPDGQPLYDGEHASHNRLKTLRSAETAATSALFDAMLDKRLDEDPETHRDADSGYRTWAQIAGEKAREAAYLIQAIAAKKGQTFEETLAEHSKKAEAKLRRADREWAADPRNSKNRK